MRITLPFLCAALLLAACSDGAFPPGAPPTGVGASVAGSPGPSIQKFAPDPQATENARLILDGRQTFRFETFNDEAFWGDALKLHQAIAGRDQGGFGAGVSPRAALAVGLKVDAQAIPPDLALQIQAGRVDLEDPATTLALLQLNAVVGVKGIFDPEQKLKSVGITCALCHSTVDDSFAQGIGRRLDGWPNRDLDVGAIVNLSPDLSAIAN